DRQGKMPSRGAPSRRLLRRELSLVPRRKAASKRQHPQLPAGEHEPREPVAGALPQRCVSWLAPVLIALVTFTAFLPTLQNQFVAWDDDKNFLKNPHYRGLGWSHLRWMWTTFNLGHSLHPPDLDDLRPGLPALGPESRRVSSDEPPPACRQCGGL